LVHPGRELKRVYALLLAAVVASASAASGYLIYRSLGIPPSRLRPFTCVFVTLLEDEYGNTLGKLRGSSSYASPPIGFYTLYAT